MTRLLSILALLLALCAVVQSAPSRNDVRVAEKVYRASHAAKCEVCGKSASLLRVLEIHHCLPQERFPNHAADTNNFILVCRPCHTWVCHPGNFDRYTSDLRKWLKARKIEENKR